MYHRDCIIQSIGKHCFSYLNNTSKESDNQKMNKRCKKTSKKARKQDISGIQILAGGCLGQMFKLFKKNKQKYGVQLKILSHIIQIEKRYLPVQQRARDRGGLYAIKNIFIPMLKMLDSLILSELAKRLGDAFSQVI